MALVIETGAGLSDADSWVEVAAFKTWCASRGYDVTAKSTPELEIALRIGADYVNTKWRYKGERLLAAQIMEFPRNNLVDHSGLTITGVPQRVKNAQMEAAFRSFSTSLYEVSDRGGMIKSESVGPLSQTFMDGAPAEKLFQQLAGWLNQYTRDENATDHTPYMVDLDNGPYFTTGMLANPGAGLDDTTDNKA